jgi:segregation and condensation protein B
VRRLARQRDREVRAILRQLLDELIAFYASDARGVEIREIAGGFRMATKPECHDAVRQFVKSLKPALRLSLPALETLAVIAYKQPITAPEVNEIRGVDSSGVFGSLIARKLIATAGRKQVIGRPILYKTTKEFLLRFGLKEVSELPSMEEFEKMADLSLEESESSPDLESNGSGSRNLSLELDETGDDESPTQELEGQRPANLDSGGLDSIDEEPAAQYPASSEPEGQASSLDRSPEIASEAWTSGSTAPEASTEADSESDGESDSESDSEAGGDGHPSIQLASEGNSASEVHASNELAASWPPPEPTETAETAASKEFSPEPESTPTYAGLPAIQAESTPAEAAPAAPPPIEQAESEILSHDEKDEENR